MFALSPAVPLTYRTEPQRRHPEDCQDNATGPDTEVSGPAADDEDREEVNP
ncbi:hypothetical protein AB0K09_07200 [Streptomyces sp. NPDC049577]|uniref:hypothetical protein n=1 Tax=Streptomyces sp. NPDC049577 TaxID=3155153 RepID=UPI003444720F